MTGHARGELIFWRDHVAIRMVQCYSTDGVKFGPHPGLPEHPHGVRALLVANLNPKRLRDNPDGRRRPQGSNQGSAVGTFASKTFFSFHRYYCFISEMKT